MVALFLEDWELGRVAMDLLCQDMRDACWVSSESLGFTPFHCSHMPVKFSCGAVTATKAFLSPRKRCDKEWDVVRDKKSKEEA